MGDKDIRGICFRSFEIRKNCRRSKSTSERLLGIYPLRAFGQAWEDFFVGRIKKPAFPCDFLVAVEGRPQSVIPNRDGGEEGQVQLQGLA